MLILGFHDLWPLVLLLMIIRTDLGRSQVRDRETLELVALDPKDGIQAVALSCLFLRVCSLIDELGFDHIRTEEDDFFAESSTRSGLSRTKKQVRRANPCPLRKKLNISAVYEYISLLQGYSHPVVRLLFTISKWSRCFPCGSILQEICNSWMSNGACKYEREEGSSCQSNQGTFRAAVVGVAVGSRSVVKQLNRFGE
jgi:hypothetical protein